MARWIGPALFLAALGAGTYTVSLAARLPASAVADRVSLPSQIIDVSGTVWNGRAVIRGGYEVRWTTLPWRSLFHLAVAVEWSLEGRDTSLRGRAALRPDAASLDQVEGRAGWGLARMAVPNLTVECDGSAALSLSRVVLSQNRQGAEGQIRTGPAVCVDTARVPPAPVEAPPLNVTATMEGAASLFTVATVAEPAVNLAEVRIADRVLAVTVHPEGARLASLPSSGPITLEYPF